jgi:hypothetical protein
MAGLSGDRFGKRPSEDRGATDHSPDDVGADEVDAPEARPLERLDPGVVGGAIGVVNNFDFRTPGRRRTRLPYRCSLPPRPP